MIDQAGKVRRFLELHHGEKPLLLPNPWDAGSARILAASGFEALATTSAGLAFSLGRRDAEALLSREETLANAAAIVEAHRKKTAPPQYTKLGGLIYIHGNGAKSDWTWGCVALENADMKELFDAVSVGTPVTIKP